MGLVSTTKNTLKEVAVVFAVLSDSEALTKQETSPQDKAEFSSLYNRLQSVMPNSAFGGKRVHLDQEKIGTKKVIHCYVTEINYGQRLILNDDGTVTQEAWCEDIEQGRYTWGNAKNYNSVHDGAFAFCHDMAKLVHSEKRKDQIIGAMHARKQYQAPEQKLELHAA